MMRNANVNANMQRDLVSNAGGSSRLGELNYSAKQRSYDEQFEHGKTLLNNRAGLDRDSQMEEDLRSLRSEYDYGSKKKFVDVLGNVSTTAKLNKMRAEHEMDNAGAHDSAFSYRSSKYSRQSKAVSKVS
jgi:hypothetical protein